MELQELTQQALALPVADRIELAQALWASLESAHPSEPDDATLREVLRRNAEIESGLVEEIPYDVILRSLNRKEDARL